MKIIKVLNRKFFKAGYEVREELWESLACDDTDGKITMKTAYTVNGDYIGDPRWAKKICRDKGVTPQLRTKNSNVCSIGFSTKDGKWYGWSHRAIFGFKIGSKVKKGDCGYIPVNKKDFVENCKRFWLDDDSERRNVKITESKLGVRLKCETKNVKGEWFKTNHFEPWQFGKGEWVAQNIGDAKQMAMDFADSVS